MPNISVIVVDENGNRLSDVLVRAVNSDGVLLQTATTEEDGTVDMLIGENQAVFFLARASYSFDKYVADLVEGGEYEFGGLSSALVPATSPEKCRVQGLLESADGTPLKWTFKLLGTSAVNNNSDILVANKVFVPLKEGYFDVELPRGQSYFISPMPFPTLSGEDNSAVVYIPNSSAAKLIDVISPIANSATFDLAEVILDAGDTATAQIAFSLTDGRVLTDDALEFLSIESSNEQVAIASLGQSSALVSGLSAGNATLTLKATSGLSPYYRVSQSESLATLSVTVR